MGDERERGTEGREGESGRERGRKREKGGRAERRWARSERSYGREDVGLITGRKTGLSRMDVGTKG